MHKPSDFDSLIFKIDILNSTKNGYRCLVIEGSSDKLFYKKMIPIGSQTINIVCCNSNDAKKDILNTVIMFKELQDSENILFVVDKDNGQVIPSVGNLLTTDFSDVENYYIQLSSFKNYIIEYFNNDKIAYIFGDNKSYDNIRLNLYKRILVLSSLRQISYKNNMCIPFGKIIPKSPEEKRKTRHKSFKKILNENDEVCLDNLLKRVCDLDANFRCRVEDIKNNYSNLSNEELVLSTNGHDLISMLTVLTSKVSNNTDDIETESRLRLTISDIHYSEFPNLSKIYDWVAS